MSGVAIYTEVNAKLQAEAMRLGAVTFPTDTEAAAASRTNDGQIGRAWELWRMQAQGEVQPARRSASGGDLLPREARDHGACRSRFWARNNQRRATERLPHVCGEIRDTAAPARAGSRSWCHP